MPSRKDEPIKLLEEAESLLPPAKESALTPISTEGGEINISAIRRQKVRELHSMGYDTDAIGKILSKGIKINNIPTKIPCTAKMIREDLDWIIQEELVADRGIPEKKQEIKLMFQFLYNRAMIEYMNAKGGTKNSFLNTAKAILDKIAELEGVTISQHSVKLFAETRPSQVAAEVEGTYNEDEQAAIDTTIEKVLEDRKRRRTRKLPVVSEESGVRTPPSADEGISGEPGVRNGAGQTEATQQKSSD